MNNTQEHTVGTWIPLLDYALKKRISLSTLRRYIKANKLVFKVENGRYLLWDDGQESLRQEDVPSEDLQSAFEKIAKELQRAQEEIAELKTLIAFYEEKIPHYGLSN